MGCCHFRNYHHILLTSKDGILLNFVEFPLALALGAYATIPKAPQGKPVDHLPAKHLDIVHVDIAFGDCVSTGGFKYALIFVDCTTHYYWSFALKLLQHSGIQSAFLSFQDEAGSLARSF